MKISIIRGEKWTIPLTCVRKNLKRGCQHPSHKLEILWQVAKNSFSRLLSYFVVQYNCGVVRKYILVFEKWVFSFDRSNMQIFTLNITRVVWPHLTNLLDLRYLCRHNPLLYHLNLIPCHWSWQRNIYFWWIFLSDILFLCRKIASKQRQFDNDRYDSIYWPSSF